MKRKERKGNNELDKIKGKKEQMKRNDTNRTEQKDIKKRKERKGTRYNERQKRKGNK